jgi:hypothetical protein
VKFLGLGATPAIHFVNASSAREEVACWNVLGVEGLAHHTLRGRTMQSVAFEAPIRRAFADIDAQDLTKTELGERGWGRAALHNVDRQTDHLTDTYGEAIFGAMDGFIAGRGDVINLLRRKARPYLCSDTLAPRVWGGALAAIRIGRDLEGEGPSVSGPTPGWTRAGLAPGPRRKVAPVPGLTSYEVAFGVQLDQGQSRAGRRVDLRHLEVGDGLGRLSRTSPPEASRQFRRLAMA